MISQLLVMARHCIARNMLWNWHYFFRIVVGKCRRAEGRRLRSEFVRRQNLCPPHPHSFQANGNFAPSFRTVFWGQLSPTPVAKKCTHKWTSGSVGVSTIFIAHADGTYMGPDLSTDVPVTVMYSAGLYFRVNCSPKIPKPFLFLPLTVNDDLRLCGSLLRCTTLETIGASISSERYHPAFCHMCCTLHWEKFEAED